MHKLAIVSDIHGNLHAFEAVMKDLAHIAPDEIIVAGDLVGRGPRSKEVLDLVISTGWPTIMGNHEQYWIDCNQDITPEDWQNGWWTPTRNEIKRLAPAHFEWMAALPRDHIVELSNAPSLQVVHGSPRRLAEGLYTDDSDDTIYSIVEDSPHSIIVGAHTHVPMERHVRDKWLLNCGSVGAPFNQNTAAQYIILTLNNAEWSVEFRRVQYDVQAELKFWQTSGYINRGVAARIFALELETATFHFWHYVRFCQVMSLPLNEQASLSRYSNEFPAYAHYCEAHNLVLSDKANLELYRAQAESLA